MKHSEIVTKIATEMGMSQAQAKDFVKNYLSTLVEATFEAGTVSIPGFGTLSARHMPSREARSPATGEMIKTQEKTVLKFKASKSLEKIS